MVALASAPRTPENTALQAWNSSRRHVAARGDRAHQDEQRNDRQRIGARELDRARGRTSSAPAPAVDRGVAEQARPSRARPRSARAGRSAPAGATTPSTPMRGDAHRLAASCARRTPWRAPRAPRRSRRPAAASQCQNRGSARSAVTSLNSRAVARGDPALPRHHREHDDREQRAAALERRHQRGARSSIDVDHDVLVAQEHRRQREKEGAGEQQLDQLVDAADRQVEAARSVTSATVSSIMPARNDRREHAADREQRSRQRFTPLRRLAAMRRRRAGQPTSLQFQKFFEVLACFSASDFIWL